MNEYQITDISIKGYKSIKDISLSLNDLNILIGGNGAGKSNFISLFAMLQSIIDGKFALYVGENGSQALLHNGRKATPEMEVDFRFGNNGYGFSVVPSNGDRLIFSSEWFYWNMRGRYQIASGHSESEWKNGTGTQIDEFVQPILEGQKWRVYHFHDTGKSSPMKQSSAINDNMMLATDARNLAAFLYRLKKTEKESYLRIVNTIRLIAPFFDDFVLRENPFNNETILLEWQTKDSDIPFTASQLSDGTLRFICLTTLLMQPDELKPETIIIDEPELGLHPAAITVLASMLKSTSHGNQILVSTQSVELLNEFSPEDIVVVDRIEGASVFKRLDAYELADWLDNDYSIGELWQKNIFGGRPAK